ncbi:MAG: valine--tRNA ligase [Deltaproteobacteria bacterium]|nr:valine--tRNA ligase [Deltaproteobacteria bacterium]
MDKAYNPESFESRIYGWWEKSGCFKADDASDKPPFMIAMPPPNVTGALHNGHALTVTIEDALTRWKRMCGFNALWMPGTDHAGIATQMVVERELAKDGLSRHKLGREAFIQKVWEWKEKYGNIITTQLRRLGASPDWSRERFTMDSGLSLAVREVFVSLYEQGLLYRGARIINWCFRCHTALSDLEVVPTERKGHFWHVKYVLSDGSGELVIATTRPETLLGDTAVAVHPEDERYKKLVGEKVRLPLLDREIPIIADAYVDREFGSGALKITPGHDFNDNEIGKRHNLSVINLFDKEGRVNEHGGPYKGRTIAEAREKIVADLIARGLLVRTEDHAHSVGVCQRCERVVEPTVSDQWFVNVKPLAEKAIAAVKLGEKLSLAEVDAREDAIKLVPEGWVNTYYQWMENIRDWCVSRQLWWGHQIPAWYCDKCGHITVSRTDVTKCGKCGSIGVKQDPDVLDTWFSSSLWPFSTLGWPEKTKALETFYPTAVMETGFDILFFWVARMIMMGLHFNGGRAPFKRVYLHAMVRDEKGQKMSKTKGNVIDPLDIIRDFGADAFRFTLSAMAGQGRDVKLSFDRIGGYKAFCNKLWNASRYVLMRLGYVTAEGLAPQPRTDFTALTGGKPLGEWISARRAKLHPVNAWILECFEAAAETVHRGFEEFRLNEAANEVFTFVWNEYCDWYIEFSKSLLESPATADETKVCMLYVLEQTLALAHPLIPFVTEEIFQHLPPRHGVREKEPLMLRPYPVAKRAAPTHASQLVGLWKNSIEALRAFRGENGIAPKARPKVTFEAADAAHAKDFQAGVLYIKAIAQLESLEPESGKLKGDSAAAEILSEGVKFYVPLAGLVDVSGEKKRLEKEKADALKDIEHVKNKLAKETFISKAPKELVDKEREKLAGFAAKLAEIERAISKLQKVAAN